PIISHPTLRALLAACLFVYVAQNMLNASIAPLARALGLAEWIVGLAISSAALFVTTLSQFWGRRSVAWGRRRVMLTALSLALVAGTLFALAVALRSAGVLGVGAAAAVIVVARGPFFGAAVSAIPPTGQTLIAKITPDERSRVAGMSAFSGSIQLSIVVGSLLSSLLGSWSILAPVWATPVCVALAFVIGWAGIPRDRPRRPGQAGEPAGEARVGAGVRQVEGGAAPLTAEEGPDRGPRAVLPPRLSWGDRRVLPWIGSAFGMFFAAGVVQIIIGFVVQDRLGVPPQRAVPLTAVMLLANAAGAMLSQLLIVPRLGWPPRRLMRVGVSGALVCLAVLSLAPTLWLMAAATFCIGLANGLVAPGYSAGGSLAVRDEEQGAVAGVLNASASLTWIFAPVTATALYGWHPAAPFVLALAVLAVSAVTAWTARALRA
ncbi:MFS transporter, partial [Actinomyces sp. 187325]